MAEAGGRGFDPGNFEQLLQQAQKMQTNIQQAQKALVDLVVKGEAGGDAVRVVMTGRHEALKVEFGPQVFQDGKLMLGDVQILADLIAAAFNDAGRRVESASRKKMSGLMEGISLPSDLALPKEG